VDARVGGEGDRVDVRVACGRRHERLEQM
jgi:hypothetical protein